MKAKPPPKTKLSQWIESEIRLPESVAAVSGRIRLYRPQVDIADAIGDPSIERVTIVKPVRVGFTTLLTGAIAGFVANDPSPILAVLPTEADCRDYVVSDIEPIFDASPAIRKLLSGDTKEGDRDTMLSRRFPGGSLKVVAAKSPRNLRRHNVRVLLMDEVDGMPVTVEGNPLLLAEKRTLSFPDRKIVVGSTPTDADTSNVLARYAESDQRIFECPCPHCGSFHELRWKDIKWDEKPEEAAWFCPACGTETDEKHKLAMVENGRWRATKPEVKGHAGFRLNALVSLLENASWGKLAVEFVAASKDPEDIKTFVNTILAEGTNGGGTELDEQDLLNRREQFGLEAMPAEVLSMTAGVDVQHDRLETTLMGWDRAGLPHVLAHVIIDGQWNDDETWAELDELLKSRWQHPLGGTIGLDAVCIDAGDGVTMDKVLGFTGPRIRRKVMAIKGRQGNIPWIAASRSEKRRGSLWIVGVDGIKAALFGRLAKGEIRFSDSLEADYFEQLTGERMLVRYRRGAKVYEFVPVTGKRHETLDCAVYAIAAHKSLTINHDRRESELRVEHQPPARPRVVKSEWATAHRN
ncbi:phage terminase large subunit family protein [Allorhizobium sp. NPDC080224]|uniref:phage terminase large subunit family protein n=1 Tax=Allorhizobium sp. NPDC080224 TaxID=3390547 RepID=UPI003CFDA457